MKKICVYIVVIIFFMLLSSNGYEVKANISMQRGFITREEKIVYYNVSENTFCEYFFVEWYYGSTYKWYIYNNDYEKFFSFENPWHYIEDVLEVSDVDTDHIKVLIENNNTYEYVAYIENRLVNVSSILESDVEDNNQQLLFNDDYIVIGKNKYTYYNDVLNYNFSEFVNQKNENDSLMIDKYFNFDTINNSFYYDNLKNNFGDNNDNTCGFVSIASLLSYYNVLYNSDFINSEYLDGTNYNISSEASTVYLDEFLESPGYNDSFRSFLFNDVGKGMLGFTFLANVMTPSKQVSVLQTYIDNFTPLSNHCNIQKCGNNVMQEIVNEIDNNRPVLITIYSWCGLYTDSIGNKYSTMYYGCPHVMIVYGYDIAPDNQIYLKCHTGWKGKPTMIIRPFEVDDISIVKLNYDTDIHKCGNNAYRYRHNDNCSGFSLCSCKNNYSNYCQYVETSCTTKSYLCPTCNVPLQDNPIYNHDYIWANSIFSHSGVCSKCNELIEGEHLFMYDRITHLYKCPICNFSTAFVPTNSLVIPLSWLEKNELSLENEEGL